MAEVISRLKLDSAEFDSKIKRAAQGIQRMAEECHKAGGMLNVLEDENRKYIQSIGQMETVSKTARGSVAELTAAFMDMKHVYNELSEEEKKGEVGRELNKQLTILKQRINEGNQEIRDMQQELNGGLGGALDSITDKFGVNIKQLVSFGTVLGAGSVALDVAKDAFFANETQLDEWGRVVQSSESLYNGFLNALNTGDISGYLNSIDDIVDAARDAYDALDSLSTFNAFTRGSRAGLRSNYSEALNDYKLNPTAENKKRLADANKALIEGMQQQADKMKYAYEKSLNSLGVDRLLKGERLEEFKNLFRSGNYEELERMKAGYSQGKMLNAGSQYWYGDKVYDGKIQDRSTGLWRAMDENEKRQFEFARVLSQVNDKQIDSIQALDEQYKNTLDAINNQNRSYNRLSGNNGRVTPIRPRRGGTTNPISKLPFDMYRAALAGSQTTDRMPSVLGMLGAAGANQAIGSIMPDISADIAKQSALVEELRKQWAEAEGEIRDGYVAQIIAAEEQLRKLKDEQSVSTGDGRKPFDYGRDISTQWKVNKKGQLVNGKDLAEDGKNVAEEWRSAASAIGAVGNAMSQIEDPAAKVMGTIAQAIATIALTFASSLKGTVTPWDWIAAAAAGTATMISTISAIHSATGYAQGGIVKGNSYSGDNIGAMVDNSQLVGLNAGEVVLTKAMQNNLAGQLQGGGLQNLHLEAVVTGEHLRFILNSNGRRTGRGEYVTTNFR